MLINEKYDYIKNIVAKTYGININENGFGNKKQIETFSNDTFVTIRGLEKIFNNLNLFTLNSVTNSNSIISLCFEKDKKIGRLYHKMLLMFCIDNYNKTQKEIESELIHIIDCHDGIRSIISEQYGSSIYTGADNNNLDLSKVTLEEEMIFLFNLYLTFFIRQINDEIFISNLDALTID